MDARRRLAIRASRRRSASATSATGSPRRLRAPSHTQTHVCVRGRQVMHREGHRWAPDRWEHRNGSYHRTAGHWERDDEHFKAKKHKNRDHDNRGRHARGKRGDRDG